MSSDVAHRKLNKYEWAESAATKGAAPHGNGLLKEVCGSAAACSEKKVFMIGGFDPRTGRSLSQLAEFDFSSKSWSKGVSMPEKIRDATAVAFGECCLVFGGWNDEFYSKNLWLFSPKCTETSIPNNKEPVVHVWTLVKQSVVAPSARVCHSMVLGTMHAADADASPIPVVYLFGGFDGQKRLNDVWRLRLHSLIEHGEAEWELLDIKGGFPPSPRDDAAVAFDAANERLVVFGGFSSSLQNDLFLLSLRAGENVWTCQPCLSAPPRRRCAVAAVSNGQLVVCLGEDEKNALPQVLQLSFTDFKWSLLSLEKEDLTGRRGSVGCASEKSKRIVIFGGGLPPKVQTCLLELELEKADAGTRKK